MISDHSIAAREMRGFSYFTQGVVTLLLLITLTTSCLADSLIYMRIDRAVLEKRVQVAPPTPQDRLRTLRTQFRNAGCPIC